jgi:hypothetical protein
LILSLAGMLLAAAPAGADQTITLVYFGNLNGELEPCGCAEESNLGGIRRQAHTVGELRKKVPELFLVSTGGLLTSELPSDRIKSEYIIKGYAAMNFDAIGVQARDLAFGADMLRVAPVPWVSSNAPYLKLAPEQRVKRGSVELAVFSWLDTRDVAAMGDAPRSDPATVQKALGAARAGGGLTVLLTTLPLDDARKTFALRDVDILMIRPQDETYGVPRLEGQTLVLQPGTRGMRMGQVEITLDAQRRIAKFAPAVTRLPSEVPDAPELDGWYRDYTAALKEDYLRRVEVRKNLNTGKADYVGAEACQTCHAKEHEIWTGSQHSHAFEKLEEVGKTFDPNCVGCHVVGYDKPGGYIDSALTSHLVGVQCENCHGAARAHVESGGASPVANTGWEPARMCGQCHVGSHSPSFALDKYWPRIRHGTP